MIEGGLRTKGQTKNLSKGLPLVSVITVVYNGAEHLEYALQSVLCQDYPNLEYIVIDGGSSDGSVDIIRQYDQQLDYWRSEPDSGIYNAMNKGLSLANGEIIGLLNADDFYYPGAVEAIAEAAQKGENEIFCGEVNHLQELSNICLIKRGVPDISRMEETMTVIHPAVFVRKKVYDEIGNFDESYRIAADYDFLLRCFTAGKTFTYLPQILTGYRAGGLSSGNCASILEAKTIKERHLNSSFPEMLDKYRKCSRKQRFRKFIYPLAKVFGWQKILEQRLVKKWNAGPDHRVNS